MRELLGTAGMQHLAQVLTGEVILAQKCEKCGHHPKRDLKLESTIGDRTRVAEVLARFGIGVRDQINVISPEVRSRVAQTVSIIASRKQWDSEALLKELDPVWTKESAGD